MSKPSMDKWLEEAKADESAKKIGMQNPSVIRNALIPSVLYTLRQKRSSDKNAAKCFSPTKLFSSSGVLIR